MVKDKLKDEVVKTLSIKYGIPPSKVMVIIRKEAYQNYFDDPNRTAKDVVGAIAQNERLKKSES